MIGCKFIIIMFSVPFPKFVRLKGMFDFFDYTTAIKAFVQGLLGICHHSWFLCVPFHFDKLLLLRFGLENAKKIIL